MPQNDFYGMYCTNQKQKMNEKKQKDKQKLERKNMYCDCTLQPKRFCSCIDKIVYNVNKIAHDKKQALHILPYFFQ